MMVPPRYISGGTREGARPNLNLRRRFGYHFPKGGGAMFIEYVEFYADFFLIHLWIGDERWTLTLKKDNRHSDK